MLVVFLSVELYKLMRGGTRAILWGAGQAHKNDPAKARLQPRRYDFVWILGAALAADRVRAAHHSHHLTPHLQNPPRIHGLIGSGTGPVTALIFGSVREKVSFLPIRDSGRLPDASSGHLV